MIYNSYENKNNAEFINEFKYIINEFLCGILPIEKNADILHENIEQDPLNKQLIIEEKIDGNKFLTFYPSLKNSRFLFRYKILDEYSVSLDCARSILNELLAVCPYYYIGGYCNERYNFGFTSDKFFNENQRIYIDNIYKIAFEKGLCNNFSNLNNVKLLIFKIIEKLVTWSCKTYEGARIPFGFIIETEKNNESVSPEEKENEVDILEFLDTDYCAVFADGINTCINISSEGKILNHSELNKDTILLGKAITFDQANCNTNKNIVIAPYSYELFAQNCIGNKLGIMLLENGDILIFRKQRLEWAKRNNKWTFYDFNRYYVIIKNNLISNEKDKDVFAKKIYCILLDASFEHNGGCLGIISENDNSKKLYDQDNLFQDNHIGLEMVNNDEKLRQYKITQKKKMIKKSIRNKNFCTAPRKVIIELLSLDGATIIMHSSEFIAAGSIISLEGGSAAGGREKAAITLSKYGLGIKISQDGGIKCYKTEGDEIKILFSI